MKMKKTTKKLIIAAVSFLMSVILIGGATYAYITLSTRPEVKEADVVVGGNGALEIALSSSDHLDELKSNGMTDSAEWSARASTVEDRNLMWGNVVDLSSEEYGLQDLILKPGLLNVNGGIVGKNPVAFPIFGKDGRVSETSSRSLVGVFDPLTRNYLSDDQSLYGVRFAGRNSSTELWAHFYEENGRINEQLKEVFSNIHQAAYILYGLGAEEDPCYTFGLARSIKDSCLELRELVYNFKEDFKLAYPESELDVGLFDDVCDLLDATYEVFNDSLTSHINVGDDYVIEARVLRHILTPLVGDLTITEREWTGGAGISYEGRYFTFGEGSALRLLSNREDYPAGYEALPGGGNGTVYYTCDASVIRAGSVGSNWVPNISRRYSFLSDGGYSYSGTNLGISESGQIYGERISDIEDRLTDLYVSYSTNAVQIFRTELDAAYDLIIAHALSQAEGTDDGTYGMDVVRALFSNRYSGISVTKSTLSNLYSICSDSLNAYLHDGELHDSALDSNYEDILAEAHETGRLTDKEYEDALNCLSEINRLFAADEETGSAAENLLLSYPGCIRPAEEYSSYSDIPEDALWFRYDSSARVYRVYREQRDYLTYEEMEGLLSCFIDLDQVTVDGRTRDELPAYLSEKMDAYHDAVLEKVNLGTALENAESFSLSTTVGYSGDSVAYSLMLLARDGYVFKDFVFGNTYDRSTGLLLSISESRDYESRVLNSLARGIGHFAEHSVSAGYSSDNTGMSYCDGIEYADNGKIAFSGKLSYSPTESYYPFLVLHHDAPIYESDRALAYETARALYELCAADAYAAFDASAGGAQTTLMNAFEKYISYRLNGSNITFSAGEIEEMLDALLSMRAVYEKMLLTFDELTVMVASSEDTPRDVYRAVMREPNRSNKILILSYSCPQLMDLFAYRVCSSTEGCYESIDVVIDIIRSHGTDSAIPVNELDTAFSYLFYNVNINDIPIEEYLLYLNEGKVPYYANIDDSGYSLHFWEANQTGEIRDYGLVINIYSSILSPALGYLSDFAPNWGENKYILMTGEQSITIAAGSEDAVTVGGLSATYITGDYGEYDDGLLHPWSNAIDYSLQNTPSSDMINSGVDPEMHYHITDVYSFAVDLLFRTNAADAGLVLQTNATGRIDGYDSATLPELQGEGSTITIDNEAMADAVTVVFADTLTREVVATAHADAYGNLIVDGEENGYITALTKNKVRAITAWVYLDITKVSAADFDTASIGRLKLNLQFKTDEHLVPATGEEIKR